MTNLKSVSVAMVAASLTLVGCVVGDGSDAPGGDDDTVEPPTTTPPGDSRALVTTLFRGGPIRTPVPANPVLDPESARFVGLLEGSFVANMWRFGISARYATAADPVYAMQMTPPGGADWGQPFDQVVAATQGSAACSPLHIPEDMAVPTGDDRTTDGWIYVIDTTKPGLICAIWQANKTAGTWTASYGGVLDVNGDGPNLAGSISGSNIPHNPILASEIASGSIEHALSFASNKNDPTASAFRAPATKTDGNGAGLPGDLQEGMRFQLDPAFDCAAMPNSNNVERMVCVALQKYGMYDNDSTAGKNGFIFQTDDLTDPDRVAPLQPGQFTRPGALYSENGLVTDYQDFPNIPLARMRLLKNFDGQ